MSDLTDNQFYPTINNAGKYCDITLNIMVMLRKLRTDFERKEA